MNPIERAVRRVDRFQQGFGPAGFVFGVFKKYGDDRGGQLAALIAYYGFVSVFPLLLLLVTILALFVGDNSHLAKQIENSALRQFPVIGNQLGESIKALHRNTAWGLIIGLLGLIWGSMGAIANSQFALAEVWNVPNVVRPNYWVRLARTLLMMVTLGVFLLLSSAAAAFAGSLHGPGALVAAGTLVLTLLLNVLLFATAYRLLTPKQVATRPMVPGAILGGFGWTVLQFFGTAVVQHLKHTSQIYGFFWIVLTLVAWIYLGTQLFVYSAEMSVVLDRRLWPRAMVQPPITEADRRVLEALAEQAERRPELRISTRVVGDGTTAADDDSSEDGSRGPEGSDQEAAPGSSSEPAPAGRPPSS